MIAGTPFRLAAFNREWRKYRHHAGRWLDQKAIEESASGNAVCLTVAEGMVTITLSPGPDGRMRAFVLMAVAIGNPGAFRKYEDAMLTIARDMGADALAFTSPRKGWRRVLGPEWQQDGAVFSRSL